MDNVSTRLGHPNKCQNPRGGGQTTPRSKACSLSASMWKEAEKSNSCLDGPEKRTAQKSQQVLAGRQGTRLQRSSRGHKVWMAGILQVLGLPAEAPFPAQSCGGKKSWEQNPNWVGWGERKKGQEKVGVGKKQELSGKKQRFFNITQKQHKKEACVIRKDMSTTPSISVGTWISHKNEPLAARWDAAQLMNLLIKPIRSSKNNNELHKTILTQLLSKEENCKITSFRQSVHDRKIWPQHRWTLLPTISKSAEDIFLNDTRHKRATQIKIRKPQK